MNHSKPSTAMKIGVVTSSYPQSSKDDTGNFVHRIALEIKKFGGEVSVIAPYVGGERSYTIDGITVERFDYFYPRSLQELCGRAGMSVNIRNGLLVKFQLLTYSLAIAIKTLTRFWDVDLVHVHWPLPNALGALALKKIRGVPFINTIYGAEVYLARRYNLDRVLRTIVREASISTVVSHGTFEACLAAGYNKEKMVVIHSGIDTDFYRPLALPGDQSKCRILSVGSLIERKGFEYLIEAVAQLASARPNLTLTIVGRGPRKAALQELAGRKGLSDRVSIIDYADDSDLLSLYNASDLFVLPSVIDSFGDTEGLGAVLLEALACKLAVVATDVGGIPDIVKHKVTGLLVPQRDAESLAATISALLENQEERKRLAENGYRMVLASFGWKTLGKKYVELFESVRRQCQ